MVWATESNEPWEWEKVFRVWIGSRVAVTVALALLAAAPALAQDPREGAKQTYVLELAPKSGLSARDREIARAFLAERASRFPEAPEALAAQLNRSRRWSSEFLPYAQSVPRRLERQLSPPAEGTFRIIFDRTLLLVRAENGAILDRVDAADE